MPSKDSKVLSARVPIGLAEAIRKEAARRELSVSALLVLRLTADYARGRGVQKPDNKVQDMDKQIEMETNP